MLSNGYQISRVTVEDGTIANTLPASFQKGIFLRMETEAFVRCLASGIAPGAAAFITVLESAWGPVIPDSRCPTQGRAMVSVADGGKRGLTHPVETMRLLRTSRAPTRRFMQLDRCEAREASCMK